MLLKKRYNQIFSVFCKPRQEHEHFAKMIIRLIIFFRPLNSLSAHPRPKDKRTFPKTTPSRSVYTKPQGSACNKLGPLNRRSYSLQRERYPASSSAAKAAPSTSEQNSSLTCRSSPNGQELASSSGVADPNSFRREKQSSHQQDTGRGHGACRQGKRAPPAKRKDVVIPPPKRRSEYRKQKNKSDYLADNIGKDDAGELPDSARHKQLKKTRTLRKREPRQEALSPKRLPLGA